MKAEIVNPCAENWNLMSPVKSGCGKDRFCVVCKLNVVNADYLNDEELAKEANTKGKVCVRISPTRVKSDSIRIQTIAKIEAFLNKVNFKRAAAFVTAVLLFASCCRQRIMGAYVNCTLKNDRIYPMNEYNIGTQNSGQSEIEKSGEKIINEKKD